MKRVFVIALAALVIPWQVARAAPSGVGAPALSLSSAVVAPGGPVTVIGVNFPASQPCSITINTSPQFVGSNVSSDPSGRFSITVSIPTGTQSGTYTVTGICAGISAMAILQVGNPQVSFTPSSVGPGGTVTVGGSGFAPNVVLTLSVTFNLAGGGTQPVNQAVQVGGNGGFATTLAVPATAVSSTYAVRFLQGSGVVQTGTLTVGQATSLVLTPSSVPAGAYTTFTASGTNFLPGERIDVSYTANLTSGGTQQVIGSGTGDQAGALANVLLYVLPNVVPGKYTVTATGESSHRTATGQLTVTSASSITVSPATAGAGGSATITGQFFAPNATVTISAQVPQKDGTVQTVQVNAATDNNGAFSVALPIPANSASNSVTVVATQTTTTGTLTASTKLNVANLNPALVLTPSTVTPGNAVAVSGSGFLPGTPVTVAAQVTVNGGVQTISATTQPDASGVILTALTIPAGATSSSVAVTASQASIGVTTTTTLTIQGVPPTPTSTPTPSATPIPTNTPTPTATPVPPHIGFVYVRTQRHTVRAGEKNRIDAQANVAAVTIIWVHINFPTGRHYDYRTRTDSTGHWTKQFRIPYGATNRFSRRVYVHFQLWRGLQTAKTFGSFLIRR